MTCEQSLGGTEEIDLPKTVSKLDKPAAKPFGRLPKLMKYAKTPSKNFGPDPPPNNLSTWTPPSFEMGCCIFPYLIS